MDISLQQISVEDLEALASGSVPAAARAALPGALPPTSVAQRALGHLAGGKAARWCATFYIQNARGVVIGGCGFKDAPLAGQVEIGYAVAPAARGAGVGAAAVRCLLAMAAQAPEVESVIASIVSANVPSTRLVQRLGFVASHEWVDPSGEQLVQWRWSASPVNPSKATPLRGVA